ncbi:MAG: hypothetical protein VR70_10310 [Rhodospirillaceae bacterium BRH_c57]|nr:MAG: hypothetical protein VR70_10310 [Rhodospirillaceae bacterium BRH_c57]
MRQKHSARALLREMPVDAVRYGYAHGVDVWAVYCERKYDPFRWETVRRAAIVGVIAERIASALSPLTRSRQQSKIV